MKGIVFYIDALMALILAVAIISGIGVYYTIEPEIKYRTVQSEAEDIMQLLTREINTTELGLPENYSGKTYLDAIGTLWVSGNTTKAEEVADHVLGNFTKRCIQLTFDNEVVYQNKPDCNEAGKNVAVANRIVSGYAIGKRPEGYTARVLLSKMSKVDSAYVYFGGYVGEGNITKLMNLTSLDTVLEAVMEVDAGSEFELYINGNYSGTYYPSGGNMSSDLFVICNETHPTYCSNFAEENTIELKFLGNQSYVGGGYIKVKYNTSEFVTKNVSDRYNFPGIDGIINLYSSFYVPGTLHGMEALIHYMSNYTVFLNIGNATIYNGSTKQGEDVYVFINSSEIENKLNNAGLSYSYLSKKTVPLRFGMKNVSYIVSGQQEADVFSVTDISGSMNTCNVPSNSSNYDCTSNARCEGGDCSNVGWWCCLLNCCNWNSHRCNQCGGTWVVDYFRRKINVAKESNHVFIDIVLNSTGNRVGLVAYETNVDPNECHDLSTDNVSLKNKVDSWTAGGSTCICCGINEAVNRLVAQSSEEKFRSMVVMSDGEANVECPEQGVTPDLNNNGKEDDAGDDAIQAACDAWNNYGIKVYAIGFGSDVDETTMQNIADCGHGEYYYSNVSELEDVYRTVAEQILNASYIAQRVEVHEGEIENVTLYPDSYIRFNFTPDVELPGYGEISITVESPKFGGGIESPKNGSFNVPNGTRALEAKVTSYSSEYWTDRVLIFNKTWNYVYKLWDYGEDYKKLGDPFIVYIPVEYVKEGVNNVSIDTGATKENTTGGSADSRVIYTLAVDVVTEYEGVFNKSQGSNITVYYDVDLDGKVDGSVNIVLGNASDPWDPETDAMDNAMRLLLDKLNFFNDTDAPGEWTDGEFANPVDVRPDEFSFETIPVVRVPWLWGPSIFTLKVW